MEEAPPPDGTFQLVPSATPGAFDFKVAVNYGNPSTTAAIAAGTAYSAVTASQMPVRPHVAEAISSYVAFKSEPAGNRVFWQHFTAALPTTPTVTERIDPIWGKVYDHSYFDLAANTKPDRADDFSVNAGASVTTTGGVAVTTTGAAAVTLVGTRKVLEVAENDMKQGLADVTVTTASSASVVIPVIRMDEDTGLLVAESDTHLLSASQPSGTSLGSDGYYTEVTRPRHNQWLSSRRLASGLPKSYASALAWDTLDAIVWPDVLEHYEFFQVVDSSLAKATDLLATKIRDGFAGDVKVSKRLWWQSTPYTITVPEQMQPAGISVGGNLESFTIRPTLHGAFIYTEQNYMPLVGWRGIQFSYGATNFTDWPATVTQIRQTRSRGGFIIEHNTFYRPANYRDSSAALTVNVVANPYTIPYYA